MRRWYVVHTQSRAEQRALWHLENQGFQCFLPRLQKLTRHARLTRAVIEPLFPRYLFTRMDLEATAWRSINGTRGVVCLLTHGHKPTPIPEGVVERLMAEADDEGIAPLAAFGLLWQGRSVEIKSGIFEGQNGEIETVLAKGRGRVQVLLNLLGAPVRVPLPSYAIQTS